MKLVIEQYATSPKKPLKTISIPLVMLKRFNSLIPQKVKDALEKEGIHLQDIIKIAESFKMKGELLALENHLEGHITSLSLDT
jgi:hypothetical protein